MSSTLKSIKAAVYFICLCGLLGLSTAIIINEIWFNREVNSPIKNILYLQFPINLLIIPMVIDSMYDTIYFLRPNTIVRIPRCSLIYPITIFISSIGSVIINNMASDKEYADSEKGTLFLKLTLAYEFIMLFLLFVGFALRGIVKNYNNTLLPQTVQTSDSTTANTSNVEAPNVPETSSTPLLYPVQTTPDWISSDRTSSVRNNPVELV
jgi:hypothetical protein